LQARPALSSLPITLCAGFRRHLRIGLRAPAAPRPAAAATSARKRRWRPATQRAAALDDAAGFEHEDLVGTTIVDRRCAIVSVVWLRAIARSSAWIAFLRRESSALVASSKIRIAGP
jgi:hypothetical protein